MRANRAEANSGRYRCRSSISCHPLLRVWELTLPFAAPNQNFKRHTMSEKLLAPEFRLFAIVVACAAASCVAGCGKATPETPTAVRVKQVEERQRTDPNFFLKEKSVATPVAPASNALAESNGNAASTKPGAVTTR